MIVESAASAVATDASPGTGPVDPSEKFLLVPGVAIVPRSAESVQIGREPPHWLILHHAPPESVALLRCLDGSTSVLDLVAAHGGDLGVWRDLLTRLRDRGLLVRATEWSLPGFRQSAGTEHERAGLMHRFGLAATRAALAARADAVVAVRGVGRPADAIATLLVASGIGSVVYRSRRRSPVSAASRVAGTGWTAALRATEDGGRPALRPTLVVLADDQPPWTAVELVRNRTAHLPVRLGLCSATVGPMVLPTRSTCLLCVARHRTDRDAGWPAAAAGTGGGPDATPAALTWAAAALVAMEVLAFVDGTQRPGTVDATVEWWAGELAPRRRSWTPHPECDCGAWSNPGHLQYSALPGQELCHNDRVADIPRSALSRTAKLASLPLSAAGRVTLGWGQRMIGKDRGDVTAEMQRRTAEQVFEVLGTLKGGAMKFGQALSVYEAAIPDEYAEPYREALSKLQNAAPPMPTSTVHRVLAEQLGSGWRGRFDHFDDHAAAAASIGQVHRAVWHDGRQVAVKMQYPGAADALRTDLDQLNRLAPLLGLMIPGTQVRPLLAELRERVMEELDYAAEADHQRAFAAEFAGDPNILVPRVLGSAPKVIVSEWLDGTGLQKIITKGTHRQRDESGRLLTELHFSAPQRVGLLHADPHPGNYMLTDDGRLGVIDFGSVARLPHGSPPIIGRMTRLALEDRADAVLAGLRAEGFIPQGFDPDPTALMTYLAPFAEPMRHKTFHFTRQWMQQQAARMADLSSDESKLARNLNLPPSYLLIHRVTFGSLGVLCQLGATAPFREIVEHWQPGFHDET